MKCFVRNVWSGLRDPLFEKRKYNVGINMIVLWTLTNFERKLIILVVRVCENIMVVRVVTTGSC